MARFSSSTATLLKQQGIALVVVLWVLVLLSVIAASFAMAMRTEMTVTRNLTERAKAKALADAGLDYVILQLLRPRSRHTSSEAEADEEWPVDGSWQTINFANNEITISVLDEAGKIDINRANRKLLNGLFTIAGVEEDQRNNLLDALEDWRDADHLAKLNGAEDKDYAAAGLKYGAKDDQFESITELRQVMGMTNELYQKMLPLITIYSRQSGVSQKVAPREVLLAVPGIDETQIDLLLASRGSNNPSNLILTPESRLFLSARPGLAYEIKIIAKVAKGTVFRLKTNVQITHRTGRPYDILSRTENATFTQEPDSEKN